MREIAWHETDVLVVGGSYAGLWAALAAGAAGARVLVADKAVSPNGGCARFAAGDILCPLPEDGLDAWTGALAELGCGLADRGWLRRHLPTARALIEEQAALGVPFQRDEAGNLVRRVGRGGLRTATVDMPKALEALHRAAAAKGVGFLSRTPMLELVETGGRVSGAIGLDLRGGNRVAVRAKSVILACGGCGFRGRYFGMGTATGEGLAMAARRGAALESMEFANKMQTTHRDYDLCGTNRLTSTGGIFRNAAGEAFMRRYDGTRRDAAPLSVTARAFQEEELAGRGPIVLDLSGIPLEERRRQRALMPHLGALLDSLEGFYDVPQPWSVSFTGSVGASPAGLRVDEEQRTSLPGLWAAGDAAGRTALLGAQVGVGGAGLFYALVSGKQAGMSAAQACGEAAAIPTDRWKREAAGQMDAAPTKSAGDGRTQRELRALQAALFPVETCFIKSAARLKRALCQAEEAEAALGLYREADAHRELERRQAQGMALLARIFLTASLYRAESRGGHLREDYPEPDPALEGKRTIVTLKKDQAGRFLVRPTFC